MPLMLKVRRGLDKDEESQIKVQVRLQPKRALSLRNGKVIRT